MASISLDPGERFEHEHIGESITILREGNVRLVIAGNTTTLAKDVAVRVGPRVPHVMINVGEGTATVDCAVHDSDPDYSQ